MTIFEIRQLAEIIAAAMAVMPASEAASLEKNMHEFIQAKRVDFSRAEWSACLEGTGHLDDL